MSTVNINFRVDADLKREAEFLFNELGLNMSTALTAFLKQAVRSNGMPFDLKLETPNAETLAAMEDVEMGRNLHGPFHGVKELFESLNADD